ncbi:GNAT family N-acetyltransferase [Crocosphaera sp. XPORK-15E]|uniref:GNAT family N-acetyltransferase n=1 Tax=Crocosphaera sp. XPORK-15E TaxID=3110247 RepID=UPI002B221961|nr:GNAT family N-acetyltransferase [Crocosphaera sp. XPORK-15E]MEA5532506.1 GNAT family N-acetyltransferase [Crocosphaera sp. XPORK-15E]
MENLIIRSANPADVSDIFSLIQALADYEKLSHQVTGTPEALEKHLFGEKPFAEAIIAQWEGNTVGFALFFSNYSTFLTKPGLYLEDIFILPSYRRLGIGKALLKYVAQLAVERDAGRLEWSVLDWNDPAIQFYQGIGADVLPDWRICRVTGDNLLKLAIASQGKIES